MSFYLNLQEKIKCKQNHFFARACNQLPVLGIRARNPTKSEVCLISDTHISCNLTSLPEGLGGGLALVSSVIVDYYGIH